MRVLIAGGGQVGGLIARRLSREGNEVTVVDPNPERCAQLEELLDAKVVAGSASRVPGGVYADRGFTFSRILAALGGSFVYHSSGLQPVRRDAVIAFDSPDGRRIGVSIPEVSPGSRTYVAARSRSMSGLSSWVPFSSLEEHLERVRVLAAVVPGMEKPMKRATLPTMVLCAAGPIARREGARAGDLGDKA